MMFMKYPLLFTCLLAIAPLALHGQAEKIPTIACMKDSTWYVGAITNQDARDIELDLSFLASGNFTMEFFFDGPDAERDGTDFKTAVKRVTSSDKLTIHLAADGGLDCQNLS